LTSINSAEDPTSPQQSSFSKDGMTDTGVRTLDYLGLAETPQPNRAEPVRSDLASSQNLSQAPDALSSFNLRNSNRFRSFSVNTQPKYNPDSLDATDSGFPLFQNGTLTPSAAAALEAEYEMVQEKVRLHNQAVQAFAVNASAARPRARTAGLVETPQRTALRNFAQNVGPDHSPTLQSQNSHHNLSNDFNEAMNSLSLAEPSGHNGEGFDESELQVSRSLWIGSIPNSTTMSSLDAIFSRYGSIESTRVLTHKNCGFVNFESTEHAVRARQLLNGKEIFPGAGPVRIGFAKAPTASSAMTSNENTMTPSPAEYDNLAAASLALAADANAEQTLAAQLSTAPMIDGLGELESEILQIVLDFGAHQQELHTISNNIRSAATYRRIEKEIPTISEPSPTRVYDAPRLRDIRKRIDNGTCGLQEIEQIAIDMLPEIAELASDYLGNTVVQKLFEFCSEQIKDQMLAQIAPHLAEVGVHKNGTWAAQKIIDVCKTEQQIQLIVEHLRPYTVPLFLDQYGNYVLQCCLKFGAPYNDFIFETMLSQIWEIAQGRFGARAMRACLESHHATKYQQRLLAAAIALSSVQLATNTNGALLLTWLLDTCTFPRRRSVLAPRLVPHLVHLCTHKVAYLTVLKIINQRNEPEARDLIIQALFFSPNDSVLEQILRDQASGVTLIFKILTTPFLDDMTRPEVVRNISKVLTRIRAQHSQGYKRLMDEVGMSSRPGQPNTQHFSHAHPPTDRSRPATQPAPGSQPHTYQRQYSGSYIPTLENNSSPVRTGSADSFGYAPYNINTFGGQPNYPNMSYQQMTPQSQFPNYASNGPRPNNNAYMANGFGSYSTPPSSLDAFRMQNQTASPIPFAAQMSPVMSAGGIMPQNFSQHMSGNMYGYPQQQYYYSPSMQPVHAAGRGSRRVRLHS
jgi:protein JSN1